MQHLQGNSDKFSILDSKGTQREPAPKGLCASKLVDFISVCCELGRDTIRFVRFREECSG